MVGTMAGMLRRHKFWLPAALLAAAIALVAPRAVQAADEELPGRVARISEFAGELYLAPEDRASDWSPVTINYPVSTGDNLWVGLDGRAEVDFGGGQFRMSGETNVHVTRLDDRTFGLFVAQGRVNVRLRVLEQGDVARIDTPNTQITLTRPGVYRIDVAADRPQTTLVVREGEALAQVSNGLQQVLPGQTALVSGTDSVYADVRNGFAQDGFDTWSADRDRRYERNRSTAYVSRQMVGYSDLDEYGAWQQYPEYGAVWFPNGVANDWAPYRDGYWTSVGAYGPTWVDYAPWGYAPFHYGRWAYIGGRWGWCPGAYVARPYWAPALVGWYGGARWGVSLAAGGPVYGWVPLGWGEPYRPAWNNNCGSRCWNNYNRPYAVTVNTAERSNAPPTRYINAGVPGAASAVSGATFTGRRPVNANLVTVNSAAVTSAPILATAPAVAMPKPGQIPGVRPGQGGTPPPASQFYATTRPAPLPAGGSAPTAVGGSTRIAPSANSQAPMTARPAPTAVRPSPSYAPAAPAPYVAPSTGVTAVPPPASARPAPQATIGTPAPNVYVAPPGNSRPVPQSAPPAQYQNPSAAPTQNSRVANPPARQEYRPVPQTPTPQQGAISPSFPSAGANRAGPAFHAAPPPQAAAPAAAAPAPRVGPGVVAVPPPASPPASARGADNNNDAGNKRPAREAATAPKER